MNHEKSLRLQVEKWLAPTQTSPPRITQFGRTGSGARYVCVQIERLAGPLTIAFFHHADGHWRVFPPEIARPEMSRHGERGAASIDSTL